MLDLSDTKVPGRTARIGNEGLATSFYNDKDEPIADALIKILLECGQEVPDFLADKIPEEGEPLTFDDESGDEDDEAADSAGNGDANGGGDAWGSAEPVPVVVENNDSWATNNKTDAW